MGKVKKVKKIKRLSICPWCGKRFWDNDKAHAHAIEKGHCGNYNTWKLGRANNE
jgi:hypothetical protein